MAKKGKRKHTSVGIATTNEGKADESPGVGLANPQHGHRGTTAEYPVEPHAAATGSTSGIPILLPSIFQSPHAVFLTIGLVFGLAFAFLLPPLVAPDEWNHFRRALLTSEGTLRTQTFYPPGSGTKVVGGTMPEHFLLAEQLLRLGLPYTEENIRKVPMFSGYFTDDFLSQRRFSGNSILSFFKQQTASSRNIYGSIYPTTAIYFPHLYLPQAAGIAMGRLMGLPVIASLYAGRVFNLLAWLCLVYFAIRLAPVFKWLLLLLALTPTSLLQSSSLSADALTNGLSILLVAMFLRYAYDNGKGKWMPALILGLSALVAVSKLYFQFIFLSLLVPVERIGSRKKYWLFISLLVITTTVAVLLWRDYAKDLYVNVLPSVSPPDQLRYILHNPGNYLAVLWNTLSRDSGSIITTFVGKLGHYDHVLPEWFIGVHVLILLLVASLDSEREVMISLRQKIVLSAVFILSCLWIFTSQYLAWTNVGAPVAEGVQGRYFIPAVPLFLLLFYNRRLHLARYVQKIHIAIAFYASATLAFSSYVILTGYYL